MAISKERLEELLNEGTTVYTILHGGIEKVDLAKARIFGRTNNYTFIDYWCDTFDQYIETSNERLYETQKEAEWSLKYQHIPRTEELNLPYWEEFSKNNKTICFIAKDWQCYELGFAFGDTETICLDKIVLGVNTNQKTWKATEENYEKACDLCLKLFKGEEE